VTMVAPQASDARPLEHRRFERVKLGLPGRYMLRDHTEHPCWTINISRVGVALEGIRPTKTAYRMGARYQTLWLTPGIVTVP
jgi:hypothetical protein